MEVITTEGLGGFLKLFYLERIINSCIRVSIWGKIQKFKTTMFSFFIFMYMRYTCIYMYPYLYACEHFCVCRFTQVPLHLETRVSYQKSSSITLLPYTMQQNSCFLSDRDQTLRSPKWLVLLASFALGIPASAPQTRIVGGLPCPPCNCMGSRKLNSSLLDCAASI